MTWNDIYCQTSHSSTYRYFPNWFIHSRNNTMSIKEIRPVCTQTCSKLFTLALGTDTAKNSSLTLHDFPRLGVRLDLPQIILTNMKPVVASFVWYKEGHFLEPPQLNGVPSLPTLLHPRTLTTNYYELLSRFMIIFVFFDLPDSWPGRSALQPRPWIHAGTSAGGCCSFIDCWWC